MVSVFKQKTAYEMRISDWSSDVCSSDLLDLESLIWLEAFLKTYDGALLMTSHDREFMNRIVGKIVEIDGGTLTTYSGNYDFYDQQRALNEKQRQAQFERQRSEEHTSELQSLMRISYAVFCLKKKTIHTTE